MIFKSSPLVSIGIPTYNRPQALRKALESITQQSYKNLEIIVSENPSDNESTSIIKEFIQNDSRIRYFYQVQNLGLFYNFKFLADQANGEYFAWLADDDTRSLDFVEVCINRFQESSSDLLLVNTFSKMLDPAGNIIKIDRGCSTLLKDPSSRFKQYLTSICTEQAEIGDLIYGLIRTETLKFILESQQNIIAWDHIFLARLALQGEFETIPKALMFSAAGGISTPQNNKVTMAKAQLIDNYFLINYIKWARFFVLLFEVSRSSYLSYYCRIKLFLWCSTYHLTRFYRGFSF